MSILFDLFITFFKIGAFTFGGGYAMLPLIQQEVLAHGWLSQEAIVDFIAVSESTPGPFAINISTYVGMETGGFFGAVCSTLGVVMPSFIIILIIARAYKQFQNSKVVAGLMTGLRPTVIGLIAAAVITIGATVFLPAGFAGFELTAFAISAVIFAIAAVLTLKVKVHPILVIVISAVLGVVSGVIFG